MRMDSSLCKHEMKYTRSDVRTDNDKSLFGNNVGDEPMKDLKVLEMCSVREKCMLGLCIGRCTCG